MKAKGILALVAKLEKKLARLDRRISLGRATAEDVRKNIALRAQIAEVRS